MQSLKKKGISGKMKNDVRIAWKPEEPDRAMQR